MTEPTADRAEQLRQHLTGLREKATAAAEDQSYMRWDEAWGDYAPIRRFVASVPPSLLLRLIDAAEKRIEGHRLATRDEMNAVPPRCRSCRFVWPCPVITAEADAWLGPA